ncbi:Nuclear receptor 2C2-associated protein [Camelus dromedarius]|uniref:Nuclear receptor 2C2-associated protein n=1 Tax=Camelus dromedarius TaxID=9838 RepID=A0A5N4CL27_CAMDR|nr:Nuclear receptor 2C2-associated protein [Camelus dromedarius]
MTHSLVCPETVSRVSSVLNRNTRQFGKKHLFDQDEETCWNSDQGPSQWVILEFPQRICVSQLQIQFQGGFSCHQGRLEGSQGSEAFGKIVDFYPEDNNSLQISCSSLWVGNSEAPVSLDCSAYTFPVPAAEVDRLKVTFENTTDFFGRVVIYHLRVLGEKKV